MPHLAPAFASKPAADGVRRARRWGLLELFLLVASLGTNSAASEPVATDTVAKEKQSETVTEPKFIGMPIPIYNPQLDFALGAVAMLAFPLDSSDEISPPSTALLFGLVASNGSYMLGGGQRVFWDEDNHRATVGLAVGHFNSDFYGTGDQTSADIALPLGTTGYFFTAEYLRRVWNRIYVGAQYRFLHADAVLQAPREPPDELDTFTPIAESSRNSGAGVTAEFDSRDNQFSATRGFYIPVDTIFYGEALGGDVNHGAVDIAFNGYQTLHPDLILAERATLQAAFGDTPVYLLPAVGLGPDLRGYASGRYRDNIFMATQVELRWYFWQGLGAAAFAGVGSTTASVGELFQGTVLPSVGGGLRYMLHRKERLVLRVDYGHGDEEGMMYFSVSEAF